MVLAIKSLLKFAITSREEEKIFSGPSFTFTIVTIEFTNFEDTCRR